MGSTKDKVGTKAELKRFNIHMDSMRAQVFMTNSDPRSEPVDMVDDLTDEDRAVVMAGLAILGAAVGFGDGEPDDVQASFESDVQVIVDRKAEELVAPKTPE